MNALEREIRAHMRDIKREREKREAEEANAAYQAPVFDEAAFQREFADYERAPAPRIDLNRDLHDAGHTIHDF